MSPRLQGDHRRKRGKWKREVKRNHQFASPHGADKLPLLYKRPFARLGGGRLMSQPGPSSTHDGGSVMGSHFTCPGLLLLPIDECYVLSGLTLPAAQRVLILGMKKRWSRLSLVSSLFSLPATLPAGHILPPSGRIPNQKDGRKGDGMVSYPSSLLGRCANRNLGRWSFGRLHGFLIPVSVQSLPHSSSR